MSTTRKEGAGEYIFITAALVHVKQIPLVFTRLAVSQSSPQKKVNKIRENKMSRKKESYPIALLYSQKQFACSSAVLLYKLYVATDIH